MQHAPFLGPGWYKLFTLDPLLVHEAPLSRTFGLGPRFHGLLALYHPMHDNT